MFNCQIKKLITGQTKAMRLKYMADGSFPDVYDKVIPENWLRQQIDGLNDLTTK